MTWAIRPQPITPTLNLSVNGASPPGICWNVPCRTYTNGLRVSIRAVLSTPDPAYRMQRKVATRRNATAVVTGAKPAVTYKSPLHEMTQTTPTMLWNDSADVDELAYAIDNGAVGATCNPVIALGILKKEIAAWRPRIQDLTREMPRATEDQIGWKLVEELSVRAAKLLEPAFAEHRGRNGRLSIQTDPRLYRDTAAILENAKRFAALA